MEVGPGPGLVSGTWGAIASSDGDGEGQLCPGQPGRARSSGGARRREIGDAGDSEGEDEDEGDGDGRRDEGGGRAELTRRRGNRAPRAQVAEWYSAKDPLPINARVDSGYR